MKSTSNLKDTLSTLLSIVLFLAGSVNTYLQANAGQPIKWDQLVLFIGSAAIAYLTGKNPNGGTKSTDQVVNQNQQSK